MDARWSWQRLSSCSGYWETSSRKQNLRANVLFPTRIIRFFWNSYAYAGETHDFKGPNFEKKGALLKVNMNPAAKSKILNLEGHLTHLGARLAPEGLLSPGGGEKGWFWRKLGPVLDMASEDCSKKLRFSFGKMSISCFCMVRAIVWTVEQLQKLVRNLG